jgi:hypothetical protein
MTADDVAALSFPVLGVLPSAWRGQRRLAMHGTARHNDGYGGLTDSEVLSVAHAYYLHDERHPSVVITQGPVYPDREDNIQGLTSALTLLMRRRPDTTRPEAPLAERPIDLRIAGQEFSATLVDWGDERIGYVRFEWCEERRVDIAVWSRPLDDEFFSSLGAIDRPLESFV